MQKYVVNLNGTLFASTAIVHGMISSINAKKKAQDEGKGTNILPFRRFNQIIHTNENGENFPDNVEVPGISGNSFRGIERRLLVEHSFNVLNISVSELFQDLPHRDTVAQSIWFMFNNGGLTPKGSKIKASDLSVYDEIASIPWLGLLGAVYFGHQFEGSASYGIMYPLLRENAYLFKDELNLPDGDLDKLPSYYGFLEKLGVARFTRRANARDNSAANEKFLPASENKGPDSVKDSMIYGTEYLPAGLHLVSFNRCVTYDPNIAKAFKAGIALFLTHHCTLGGKSAMGFGRVKPGYGFDFNYEEAIADYDKMLIENKDDIIRKIRLIPEGLKFEMSEKDKDKEEKKKKEVA